MPKNFIPQWFEAYQKLGQPVGIHVFRIDGRDGSVQYAEHSHLEWDGFSLAVNELKNVGWSIQPPRRLKSFTLPLLGKIRALIHYIFWARMQDVQWKHFDANQKGSNTPHFHVFSKEWSEQLLASLEQNGISVNSWILHKLNTLTTPLFHSKKGVWWLPVDFRPYSDYDWKDPNIVSNIAIEISEATAPKEIEIIIQKKLMAGDPWASWKWTQFIGSWGEKTIEKVLRGQLKKNRWCGTMTYLGKWPNRFAKAPAESPYLFVGAPPAMLGHPIALGASVMNGQICLAYVTHRSLFSDQESKDFFQALIGSLSNSLTSFGTSLPAPK